MTARLRLYRCEYCGIVRALPVDADPGSCDSVRETTVITSHNVRCDGDLTPLTLGDFLVAAETKP